MLPAYKTFKHCDHGVITASGAFNDLSVINKYTSMILDRGVILDPFAGSGTTAVSAVRSGFDYLMFDISPEQCEFAEARIEYNVERYTKD